MESRNIFEIFNKQNKIHNENLKQKLNENQNILKFNLDKIQLTMKNTNYIYKFEEENCLSDTTYSDFNSNNKISQNDEKNLNYINNTLLAKTKAILNNHFRTLNIEDFIEHNIQKKEFININELNKININKKIINIIHKKSIKKKFNQKSKFKNYKVQQINSIERNNNFEIKAKNIKNDNKKIVIENNINNINIIKSNFKPLVNENKIELKKIKEMNFKIEKDKIFEFEISKIKNINFLNHKNFENKEIKEINFEINTKNKYNKIYNYEMTKEINFETNQHSKNNNQNLILSEYQLNSFFLNFNNIKNLNNPDKNEFKIIHENSENFLSSKSSNQEIKKNNNFQKKDNNKINKNKKEISNIENKDYKKKTIKNDILKEQKEKFNLKLYNIINNEKELNINKLLNSNRQLTLSSTQRESKLSNFNSEINSTKYRNSFSSLNLIDFCEEEKKNYENKTLNLKSNLSYNRVIKNNNKDFNDIKTKKELKRIHSLNEKLIKQKKKEYIDLKNEINILKKERDYLLTQKNQNINNEILIQNKPKEQIKKRDNKLSKSVNLLELEKKSDILFEKKLLEDELFKNVKYENKFDNLSQDSLLKSHDSFGEYVDKIIKRSYRLYINRKCNICVDLLSKGKSTKYCYKSHHKYKKFK